MKHAVHLTVLEAVERLELPLAGDGRAEPEAMPLLGVLAQGSQHLEAQTAIRLRSKCQCILHEVAAYSST